MSARASVLLVEDDFHTQMMLRRYLILAGHEVFVEPTLAGALAMLRTGHYRHVILDLSLPDGDGIELIKEIRARGYLCKTVICTGTTDPRRLEQVEEHEPDLLLRKPVRMPDLLKFLQEHDDPSDEFEAQP